MKLFALTIRAGAFQQSKLTGVAAAARTIIGTGTDQKLIPAILAQAIVGFTNAFAAIDADCGPKELV